MPQKLLLTLLVVLMTALLSACALPAPPTASDPSLMPETSERADTGDEQVSENRGILRMPHFLPRGGAESLDPASPTELIHHRVDPPQS